MWGVGGTNVENGGVSNHLVGSQSLANPMGFTVTQPFDNLDAEESRNQARGGSLLRAEIARRGYDAVPVEDLHSDRVAGIIPVCLG